MKTLALIKRLWRSWPLSDHSRWLITRLLLEPLLPLLKNSVIRTAYLREKEWRRKRIRPFYGDSFPSLPAQSRPDILIWGVIDWQLRIQRPQHLARALRDHGHRVFYVSTAFVNTRRLGFELEKLDDDGRLFNVRLHLQGSPHIHLAPSQQSDLPRLKAAAAALLQWTESREIISIVQHPYWHALARVLPNSRLVYDCMDHHAGFGNSGAEISELETALLKESEAVVTTSQWLCEFATPQNPNVALIRNAGEYHFFCRRPELAFTDRHGRKVLGYYGVVAEWMDLDLVAALAIEFSDCLILIVGADECGARQRLANFSNILFTGEVKYEELPFYLYAMDVCLLPFRITPLTIATNPVKVYEYLAAGKPVVAVDLPEMAQFDRFVLTAYDTPGFIASTQQALAGDTGSSVEERRAFAAGNTWQHRAADLQQVLENLPSPLISIVVLTYNNLDLTRACLDSINRLTDYESYEVIVVDNASSDGTPDFLQQWAAGSARHRVILNSENRGFSGGNNQGLEVAEGEYLVLLNNDTEVTAGWLVTLMNHLRRDASAGMVGPVTNNIGNEARIRLRYRDSEQMRVKARRYTLAHMGETFAIGTLAFYCVMFSRHVYQQVGGLDEAFRLGFFEDDDYCRRAEQAGWKAICAEDVFVHHHLSASFGKLGKGRLELLEENRKVYEAKWGTWVPHKHR